MLNPYYGEFLISPAPPHLTLPKCSHCCVYCFADPREPDFNHIKNQVLRMDKNSNLTAQFLKNKYPVCVSNTSDPFAASVVDVFLQVKSFFDQKEIPILYQTKGGTACIDTLENENRSCVYISITSDNDFVLKKYEPNAPRYAERISIIKAIAKKHLVIVGLNPFVPDWWIDIEGFINVINGLGVKHLWHGGLHIRKNKLSASKYSKHRALFDTGASRHKPYQKLYDYYIGHINNSGINSFSGGVSSNLGFWDEFYKIYKWFPTVDDWFTRLNEISGGPVAFTVHDFIHYIDSAGLPFKAEMNSYLHGFGQTLRKLKGTTFKVRSLPELVGVLFDPVDFPTVFRQDNIYILVENKKNNKAVLDDNGNYILVYHKNGDDGVSIPIADVQFYSKGGGA